VRLAFLGAVVGRLCQPRMLSGFTATPYNSSDAAAASNQRTKGMMRFARC
jgi:hypothetical protein